MAGMWRKQLDKAQSFQRLKPARWEQMVPSAFDESTVSWTPLTNGCRWSENAAKNSYHISDWNTYIRENRKLRKNRQTRKNDKSNKNIKNKIKQKEQWELGQQQQVQEKAGKKTFPH